MSDAHKTPIVPRPPKEIKPDLTGVSEDVRRYIYTLEKKTEHRYLFPRAPSAKNMVEFVVQVFVVTVASILMLSLVGAGLLVGFGVDAGPVINSITDITNTIIGALIGFVAGRGQGKQEAHDEQAEEQKRQQQEQRQQKWPGDS